MQTALEQWLTATSELQAATSNFLAASTTLRTFTPDAMASASDHNALEATLDQIHSQHVTMDWVKASMDESYRLLGPLHNTSTSRVPIHKLPTEILSRIFSIVVAMTPCTPGNDLEDALDVIPLVCALWRRVAIATGSLWSHIHLNSTSASGDLTPMLESVRLRLERARDTPIHIHLFGHDRIPESEYPAIESVLRPSIPALASLSGNVHIRSHLLGTLLDLHATNTASSPLRFLSIGFGAASHTYRLNWSTYSFQQLTELRLDYIPGQTYSPSLPELTTFLSKTPNLHTLVLYAVHFSPSQEKCPDVWLPCLRLLLLEVLDAELLLILAAALHPGRLELDVRLDLSSTTADDPMSAVQSLLARSNVVSLMLGCLVADTGTLFGLYLDSVPHLRALILKNGDRAQPYLLDEFVRWMNNDSTTKLQHLQAFAVIGGDFGPRDINMDRIKRVVAATNLSYICFTESTFEPASEHNSVSEGEQEDDLPPGGEHGENSSSEESTSSEGSTSSEESSSSEGNSSSEEKEAPSDDAGGLSRMPGDAKTWLTDRVPHVIVDDTSQFSYIRDGKDRFVQKLIRRL